MNLSACGLRILFEDQFIFAVYKPAKLHSVANNGKGGESVAARLISACHELGTVSEKQGDAGLVQRLDQMTQGILLGAKTREVWSKLRVMIQNGEIRKTYRALIEGEFRGERKLSNFLGSPYRRAKKVRVYEKDPGGSTRTLKAETVFRELNFDTVRNCTMVEVEAHSARRHQVRAHASWMGHPLAGDKLYGAKRELSDVMPECDSDFYLLAASVRFLHPVTGVEVNITVE